MVHGLVALAKRVFLVPISRSPAACSTLLHKQISMSLDSHYTDKSRVSAKNLRGNKRQSAHQPPVGQLITRFINNCNFLTVPVDGGNQTLLLAFISIHESWYSLPHTSEPIIIPLDTICTMLHLSLDYLLCFNRFSRVIIMTHMLGHLFLSELSGSPEREVIARCCTNLLCVCLQVALVGARRRFNCRKMHYLHSLIECLAWQLRVGVHGILLA